jgi:transposase
LNPVIGLDVSKGESQIQAFLDKGKPYGKSFSVQHTREELDKFLQFLKEVERQVGNQPAVILESTGHYHVPVIHLQIGKYLFLFEHGHIHYF